MMSHNRIQGPEHQRKIAPPSPWRRSLRRLRARRLRDPLALAILSLAAALLASGWGVTLIVVGQTQSGALVVSVAAIAIAIYLGLALQALKRDKTVHYWKDRRGLRAELTRERAWIRLQQRLLDFAGDAEDREAHWDQGADRALGALASDLYEVLGATLAGDLAVLVFLEANQRYRVLHGTTSRSSRWSALKQGKQCMVEGAAEEKLSQMAPHFDSVSTETRTVLLRVAILSEVPLGKGEEQIVAALPGYLGLIASRWIPRPLAPTEGTALRAVEPQAGS